MASARSVGSRSGEDSGSQGVLTGDSHFFSEAITLVEGKPIKVLLMYDSALDSKPDVAGSVPTNQSNERTAKETIPIELCLSTLDGLDESLSSATNYNKEPLYHLSLACGPLDDGTINQSTHMYLKIMDEAADHNEGVTQAARLGIMMARKELEAVNSAPVDPTARFNQTNIDVSPIVQSDFLEVEESQQSTTSQTDDQTLTAEPDQSFEGRPYEQKASNVAGDSDSDPAKEVKPVYSEKDRPWGPGWVPISDASYDERNRKRKREEREEMSAPAWNDEKVVPYKKSYRAVRRSTRKRKS